jgi:hypothetical protein
VSITFIPPIHQPTGREASDLSKLCGDTNFEDIRQASLFLIAMGNEDRKDWGNTNF